jgi:Protein of unknown function (DUF4019)
MTRIAIILSFAVFIAAAANAPADTREQAGSAAAEKWLVLVDGGHYGESWNGASSAFKRAVSKEQWEDLLKANRRPLGELKSRAQKSATYTTSLPGAPDGEYVVLVFDSSFANKKAAVETVTMSLDKNGEWRSAGYFIR